VHGHIAIYGKSAAVVNATGTKALDEITIQSREQGQGTWEATNTAADGLGYLKISVRYQYDFMMIS